MNRNGRARKFSLFWLDSGLHQHRRRESTRKRRRFEPFSPSVSLPSVTCLLRSTHSQAPKSVRPALLAIDADVLSAVQAACHYRSRRPNTCSLADSPCVSPHFVSAAFSFIKVCSQRVGDSSEAQNVDLDEAVRSLVSSRGIILSQRRFSSARLAIRIKSPSPSYALPSVTLILTSATPRTLATSLFSTSSRPLRQPSPLFLTPSPILSLDRQHHR